MSGFARNFVRECTTVLDRTKFRQQGPRLPIIRAKKKESRCVTRGDTTYSKLKREPDANIVPRRTSFLEENIYQSNRIFKWRKSKKRKKNAGNKNKIVAGM